MQIGIETDVMSYGSWGVKLVTSNLIKGLVQRGGQLTCFQNDASERVEGVHVKLYPRSLRVPFGNSLSALCRSSCYRDVDLIHFPVPKVLYGKKPKIPVIVTIHDLTPLLFPHFVSQKNHLFTKYFLGRYLREASAIVAVSENTKRDLLKLFRLPEQKIHVVHCAIRPPEHEPQFEKKPFILYLGSFEPRKNLKGVLKAFSLLRKRGCEQRLVIAGVESKAHPFQEEVGEGVDFLGYVSEEKKSALMREAALFVWPTFYEGFGFPLLEAMHHGAPIVTAKGSSMEEVVSDAALCVDPNSAEAICEGMHAILESQNLSKTCILRGIERAKTFSIDKMATQYQEVYATTLS